MCNSILAAHIGRIGYRYLDDSDPSVVAKATSSSGSVGARKQRTKSGRFPACCVVVHGDDQDLIAAGAGDSGTTSVPAIATPPQDGPPPPPPPGSSDEDFARVRRI